MRTIGLAGLALIVAGCERPTAPRPATAPDAARDAVASTAAPPAVPQVVADAGPYDIAPPSDVAASSDVANPARVEAPTLDGGAAPVRYARHNEVCRGGGLHPNVRARPCAPGLRCCYPCGIAGCDFVCHTPRECQLDMLRPRVARPPR